MEFLLPLPVPPGQKPRMPPAGRSPGRMAGAKAPEEERNRQKLASNPASVHAPAFLSHAPVFANPLQQRAKTPAEQRRKHFSQCLKSIPSLVGYLQTHLWRPTYGPAYGHGLWTPTLLGARPGPFFWSIDPILIINNLASFSLGFDIVIRC